MVQALYDMLALVAEGLQDAEGFLLDVVGVEVLGHRAVVHIRELAAGVEALRRNALRFGIVEEEILNIDHIYVSNLLQDLCLLLLELTLVVMGVYHAVYRIFATFGDLACVFGALAFGVDGERVQIALLSLEAQAHVEVVEVVIVLCLSFERQPVGAQYVLEPLMTKYLRY